MNTAYYTVIATWNETAGPCTQYIDCASRVQIARAVKRLKAWHDAKGLNIRVKDSGGREYAIGERFRLKRI